MSEIEQQRGIVKCPNCGAKINDSPKKHLHRDKICNNCKMPYKKVGVHLPSFNLDWVREKLRRKEDTEIAEMAMYIGRAKKVLLKEFAEDGKNREPTHEEIEKRAKELMQQDRLYHRNQQLKSKGRM